MGSLIERIRELEKENAELKKQIRSKDRTIRTLRSKKITLFMGVQKARRQVLQGLKAQLHRTDRTFVQNWTSAHGVAMRLEETLDNALAYKREKLSL